MEDKKQKSSKETAKGKKSEDKKSKNSDEKSLKKPRKSNKSHKYSSDDEDHSEKYASGRSKIHESDDDSQHKKKKSHKSQKHSSDDENRPKNRKPRKSKQYSSDEDETKSSKHEITSKKLTNTSKLTDRRLLNIFQFLKPLHLIKSTDELKILGTFSQLNYQTSVYYKAIAKFVNNSHDIKPHDATVKIRGIHEIDSKANQTSTPTAPSTSAKSKHGPLLLCFKTTTESVKKVSEREDGCVAFYDRFSRALAIRPEDLDRPLRQMILLCSVSLGKKYSQKSGFRTWASRDFPQGYDSVKGVGRKMPDWKACTNVGNLTIPTGTTVEHRKYPNYELTYNEYIIYEALRITVKFAVDVEVIPVPKKKEDSSEESSE